MLLCSNAHFVMLAGRRYPPLHLAIGVACRKPAGQFKLAPMTALIAAVQRLSISVEVVQAASDTRRQVRGLREGALHKTRHHNMALRDRAPESDFLG
jgi:hypothetical protein